MNECICAIQAITYVCFYLAIHVRYATNIVCVATQLLLHCDDRKLYMCCIYYTFVDCVVIELTNITTFEIELQLLLGSLLHATTITWQLFRCSLDQLINYNRLKYSAEHARKPIVHLWCYFKTWICLFANIVKTVLRHITNADFFYFVWRILTAVMTWKEVLHIYQRFCIMFAIPHTAINVILISLIANSLVWCRDKPDCK